MKLPGHENDALSVKEGDAAREHLDEQYTETPYVRGRVVHFVTGEAFWRHEHFCAEIVLGRVELVQYRQARVVQDSVSKVDQLDLITKKSNVSARKANHRIKGTYFEVTIDERVCRLDVTMRDPHAVEVMNAIDNLTKDMPCDIF